MSKIPRFEFATASKIIFGNGTLKEAGPIVAQMGKRALVVGGKTKERATQLFQILNEAQVEATYYSIPEEPTVDMVIQGVASAREAGCDIIIGFGGGSPLDTAKAIAILYTNPGDIYDYLEVIGRGRPFEAPPLPNIAIPTTAGTGTEVTKNAVIASPQHRVKVSLRHNWLLPQVALVDPILTHSSPPQTTAFAGMDALTQSLEPFVSPKANPMTNGICIEGMERAARSLLRAYINGEDGAAREDMAIVSLFGGIALANAGLGAVHGFSGTMGGMLPVPHGALCARLLPFVMDMNVCALTERDPANPAMAGYAEIARILTNNPQAKITDGVTWVHELIQTLNIPSLGDFGFSRKDFPTIADLSRRSSSMKNNMIPLTEKELTEILEQAL